MGSPAIFFSYSRKDSEFVLDLASKLRSRGVNVWLDQLDIKAGTNWDDSVEEALKKADILIVVLSKTSVESQNVRDEYSFAIEEGKTVVPVLHEPCTIPFRLRRLQYADFTSNKQLGLETLISTLDSDPSNSEKLRESNPVISEPALAIGKKDKRVSPSILYKGLGIALLATLVFYFVGKGLLPTSESETSQLTVLVHGEKGKDQLILPGRGQVKLIYGDASVIETINTKGEATFKQIPNSFFEEDTKVEILFSDPEGEPYRAVGADSSYQLEKGQYIALPVKLHGLDLLFGTVKHFDSGEFLDSVRVSIQGTETFSNRYGEFQLNIPEDVQRKFQTINAFKDGFEAFKLDNIPIQTDRPIDILLKPKQ